MKSVIANTAVKFCKSEWDFKKVHMTKVNPCSVQLCFKNEGLGLEINKLLISLPNFPQFTDYAQKLRLRVVLKHILHLHCRV